MGTAQQQPAFDLTESKRFAGTWAGFDTGNPSEAEAMAKGRVIRRLAAEKKLRIVDALELPEIRKALDEQMQPLRQAGADCAALEAELKTAKAEAEDLRGKLAVVVPKLREITEALTREKELTERLRAQQQQGPATFTAASANETLYGSLFILGVLVIIALTIQSVFSGGAAHSTEGKKETKPVPAKAAKNNARTVPARKQTQMTRPFSCTDEGNRCVGVD